MCVLRLVPRLAGVCFSASFGTFTQLLELATIRLYLNQHDWKLGTAAVLLFCVCYFELKYWILVPEEADMTDVLVHDCIQYTKLN